MDRQLVDFEDCVVYESDLRTLGPGQWLNDAVITFYLTYMHRKLFDCSGKIQILPPSIVQILVHCQDPAEAAAVVAPLGLTATEVILMPLNNNLDLERASGGTHWSLLVFSKSACEFWYFDSMGHGVPSHASAAVDKLSNILGTTKIVARETPRQTNSHDCGVYMLCISEWICAVATDTYDTAPDIEKIATPTMVDKKRREIADIILHLNTAS